MTRDFKIGLMAGVVLAFATLVFVVTRPTLSPQARMVAPPTNPVAGDRGGEPTRPTPADSASEPLRSETPLPSSTPPLTSEAGPLEQSVVQAERMPSNQVAGIDSTIYERDEKITTTKYHIVQKDETLSSISQQYYGTPNQWQKIVKANAGTVKDANRITPGAKLVIPE